MTTTSTIAAVESAIWQQKKDEAVRTRFREIVAANSDAASRGFLTRPGFVIENLTTLELALLLDLQGANRDVLGESIKLALAQGDDDFNQAIAILKNAWAL
jgi:hypothetical protein